MYIWYYFLISLAVIVVIAFALSLRGRGAWLKCPECGEIFRAPTMDEKNIGIGWTFSGTGVVRCPKCGTKRPRRDYEKVAHPARSEQKDNTA